jgi:hypothetical protein
MYVILFSEKKNGYFTENSLFTLLKQYIKFRKSITDIPYYKNNICFYNHC